MEGAITLDLPKNLMVVIQNFMNDCARGRLIEYDANNRLPIMNEADKEE